MSVKDGVKRRVQQNRSLLSGSAQLIALRILSLAISYVFTLLVSRIYGASVLGLYAMTNVVILIGVMITRGGMDLYFMRTTSSNENTDGAIELKREYGSILSLQFIIGIVLSVLLFLLAPWLANEVYSEPDLQVILQLASIIILPTAWSTLHSEGFRARKKLFPYISLTRIWPFLFGSIVVGVLWMLELKEEIYFFIGYFVSVVVTSIIGFGAWNLKSEFRAVFKKPSKRYREIIGQSFPMMMASSMFLVMSWTDTFMLGVFEEAETVGNYHVAVKISNIVTIVLFGINGIVAPKLSSTYASGDRSAFKQTVTSSATLAFVLSLPIVFGIIILGGFLLNLFGEGMDAAYTALIILAIGQFINSSCGSVMSILQMTKNQVIGQNILISAGIFNVLLNYFMIPRYGIEGAAIATAIGTVYWNVASLIAVRLKLKVWSIPFSYRFLKGIKSLIRRG